MTSTIIGFEHGRIGRRINGVGGKIVLIWFCGARTEDARIGPPCQHRTREEARDCVRGRQARGSR